MPVAGFVVNARREDLKAVVDKLQEIKGAEVHGTDDKGHIVLVLEGDSGEEMEKVAAGITRMDGVISLHLAYFHAEDEVEKIERGEIKPRFSFGRQHEKSCVH